MFRKDSFGASGKERQFRCQGRASTLPVLSSPLYAVWSDQVHHLTKMPMHCQIWKALKMVRWIKTEDLANLAQISGQAAH